jgi:DNA (cytosine-5)-methyltransferase 1
VPGRNSRTRRVRIGSLCSGYGGLDLAVQAVFADSEVAWFCDNDKAADLVYRAAFGDLPNLGDIREVDWSTVEPVDIVTAGYPCQPFSLAGKRGDWETDERHLWPYVREAVRVLEPRLVVLENVPGHRNRGFDTVLGALASLGFDADWCGVRASDAGACHRRDRLFALAHTNGGVGERRPKVAVGSTERGTAAVGYSGHSADSDSVGRERSGETAGGGTRSQNSCF